MTAPQRCVRFGLVIVGDEILSGKREDKHLTKVIELLAWSRSATRLVALHR